MRGQFPVRVVMDASGHAFRKMSILERTIFLRHAILSGRAKHLLREIQTGQVRPSGRGVPCANVAVFADPEIERFCNGNRGVATTVFNALIREHFGDSHVVR